MVGKNRGTNIKNTKRKNMNIWIRIAPGLLSLLLLVNGAVAYAASKSLNDGTEMSGAAEAQNVEMENGMDVEGTSSFGNLVAAELEGEAQAQEESNGFCIMEIEMEGTEAAVSLEAVEDCTLVVAVYDEAGETIKAVGSREIAAGETEVVVEGEIETEDMPDYFTLKGYLIDLKCLRSLCRVYESEFYTQEMQNFLKKTTDDFDENKVVNLDEDKTNNFLVCEYVTKLIPGSELSKGCYRSMTLRQQRHSGCPQRPAFWYAYGDDGSRNG